MLAFNQSEINILSKFFELIRYYITKNQQMFQQPQDIIKKLNTASSILSARNNNKNNLKGVGVCNETKFKSLHNIEKCLILFDWDR